MISASGVHMYTIRRTVGKAEIVVKNLILLIPFFPSVFGAAFLLAALVLLFFCEAFSTVASITWRDTLSNKTSTVSPDLIPYRRESLSRASRSSAES